jgi:O-methyltransferase
MIKAIVIKLMSGLNIPVSLVPFLYSSVLKNDRDIYRPFLQPWRKDEKFLGLWSQAKAGTTSRIETCYFINALASSAARVPGDFVECGVYQGGTALFLGSIAETSGKGLHLFDSFAGMPEQTKATDSYKVGSLGDTSLEAVERRLSHLRGISIYPGFMPETFAGTNIPTIALAHIDVDQYKSTLECCKFIYPRMSLGGIMIIDDYGRPGTPGARVAVDEFFADKVEKPISLSTGQCFLIKR